MGFHEQVAHIEGLLNQIDPNRTVGTGAVAEALSDAGLYPHIAVDAVAQHMRIIDPRHDASNRRLAHDLAKHLYGA